MKVFHISYLVVFKSKLNVLVITYYTVDLRLILMIFL